jgi:MiaB/RimO family radical SAM methylthiotransferase
MGATPETFRGNFLTHKNFHIITLGCKVNQYESEAIREAWLSSGHMETPTPEGADVVLVNSCAITAKAIVDLRSSVRQARHLAPGCELLVTGCAAEALPGELKGLPVNALIPQRKKTGLLSWPEENISESTDAFPALSISDYTRSRAVLKIHDGCSQHCTYGIVPLGRGHSVSRPWRETLAEASRLVKAGFREIVLSGVNLGQYGLDLPEREDFWDLLPQLENAFTPEGDGQGLRFRISSLEPGQLNNKALTALAKSKLVAPHLHLSLQSGSPHILKRMGRGHYNPADMRDFLEQLTRIWPIFGLGADFIVGFPGESEEHFQATLSMADELALTYAHVFPYSARPGTAAAKLPGQLAQEVKKERAARLRQLVEKKKTAFIKSQLALPQVRVVQEEGSAQGINEFYTDCRFKVLPKHAGKNLIKCRPLGLEKDKLVVEALP